MEANKVKRPAAETQEMDSQIISQQQYYTCEDFDNWGTLKDLSGNFFFLKSSLTYFGREIYPEKEIYADTFIFEESKMKKSIYDRLSKNHFKIERVLTGDNTTNQEPAIITCLGRNGLVIGATNKLKMNEKRILKDGDWLSLSVGAKIFQFTYIKSEENCIEKTCEIHDNFYIGEIIGRGACGQVRKVYSLLPTSNDSSGVFNVFAIKCVERPKESLSKDSEEVFNSLLNEVKIMKRIEHAHVLRLFKVYECTQMIILVFPFMGGGDLLSMILKQPNKCLNEDDSKYYFYQLISGLKYLHSKGVTHRDIKPENILLSDRGECPLLSIADFGLSKMNDSMKTQCGTEVYVAPEILKKRTYYTNAVDIWSSGVFLYAMLTGRMPFSKNHIRSLRDHILSGKYEFVPTHIWSRLSTAKNIIQLMLQVNPRNRMTAQQLLEHRWLKDDKIFERLDRAYHNNNISKIDYMDETDDLEKTLVNVSIHEEENPPKRQKLR